MNVFHHVIIQVTIDQYEKIILVEKAIEKF